jgi:hypothetical protein
VVIDGAVTPERLSDERAATVVLIALARAPDRSLRARLGSVLGATDLAVLAQELTRLQGLLLGFQQDAAAAAAIAPRTAASTHQIVEAMENSRLAAVETRQRLQEFLSADGRSAFQAYLDGEKRHMRALDAPPSPPAAGQ